MISLNSFSMFVECSLLHMYSLIIMHKLSIIYVLNRLVNSVIWLFTTFLLFFCQMCLLSLRDVYYNFPTMTMDLFISGCNSTRFLSLVCLCLDTHSFRIVISSCMLHAKSLFATLWTVSTPRLLCPWDSPGKNILQEWVAISSSRGVFPTRDGTSVSYIPCLGRRVLYL